MLALDILAVIALFAWRAWLSARHRNTSKVDDQPEAKPDSSMERATAMAGWAEGSRADWDRHVRPMLARELTELLRSKRDTPEAAAVGERMFGADLWPWVDPNQPFRDHPEQPGPGRAGLTRILDRLERL